MFQMYTPYNKLKLHGCESYSVYSTSVETSGSVCNSQCPTRGPNNSISKHNLQAQSRWAMSRTMSKPLLLLC